MIGGFSRNTAITFASRVINLVFSVCTSVVITRLLGPQGKGVYTMAVLLPALIVIFSNLGIEQATVYYVARGRFDRRQILGNNILLAVSIGCVALIAGFFIISIAFKHFATGIGIFDTLSYGGTNFPN